MTPLDSMLVAGSANPELAAAVAKCLGRQLSPVTIERFPDQEVHVTLQEDPRDRDVILIQPTSPPPDPHLMELLALSDACRRAGAAQITAVVPYFGYARQDRRAKGFEAVTARLVADLMAAAGIQRLVALDVHTQAIEGFFTLPVQMLSAVTLLAEVINEALPENGVIVSPDLGAAKLADTYASLLGLPVAIVHKVRTAAETVAAVRVTGDVRDRTPIVIDDMISTGGTIEAAVRAVEAQGARPGAIVAVTHGLFVDSCVARLAGLDLRRIIVTDSVRISVLTGLPLTTVTVAGLLAGALGGSA